MDIKIKHLLLMRHATAEATSWEELDHSRSLTPEGLLEAERVGKQLHSFIPTPPQQIYASNAKRVQQTLAQVQKATSWPSALRFIPEFYHASPEKIYQMLELEDEGRSDFFLLGHNPSWSTMASFLSGEHLRLSPAHAVLLSSSAPSWPQAFLQGGWQVERYFSP